MLAARRLSGARVLFLTWGIDALKAAVQREPWQMSSHARHEASAIRRPPGRLVLHLMEIQDFRPAPSIA